MNTNHKLLFLASFKRFELVFFSYHWWHVVSGQFESHFLYLTVLVLSVDSFIACIMIN